MLYVSYRCVCAVDCVVCLCGMFGVCVVCVVCMWVCVCSMLYFFFNDLSIRAKLCVCEWSEGEKERES